MMILCYFCLSLLYYDVSGESYEDKRCICVCPSPGVLLNTTLNNDKNIRQYIGYVPPNSCNCEGVILPKVEGEIKGKVLEYCSLCECKYQLRNTTVIKVVVIMILWTIALLLVYMGFLLCLDPLINKKRLKFHREGSSEEARNLLVQGEDED